MTGTIALILAGGIGSRLNVLVSDRAKPVVPFGGSCCIIDFTLQNTIKSGIKNIGIIAQYQSPSVQNHIEHTRVLELVNNSCDLEIFHPIDDRSQISMYHGTADAVAKNIDYIKQFNAREVLVLAGDHVYNMDYRPMIEFHREKRADLTIAMTRVPWKDISNYGIAITDGEQKISFWQEKPNHATSNLASMGIYVFNIQFLEEILWNRKGHDFGYHIIKNILPKKRIFAYTFKGYWADVGTLNAYWSSNMIFLKSRTRQKLSGVAKKKIIKSVKSGDNPLTTYLSHHAQIENSMISHGCIIEGTVSGSIIYPGVHIKKGAKVIDSIIMHDSVIEKDAFLFKVIADMETHFGSNSQVGVGESIRANKKYPKHVSGGQTIIGKKADIPPRIKIYQNTIIEPSATAESFERHQLKVGSYVER